MTARHALVAVLLLVAAAGATPAVAQDESRIHADFRKEGDRVGEDCSGFGVKTLAGCAMTLVTDHPLHLAVGSIAPQNGFAFGLALGTDFSPSVNWRSSFSVDAVGAPSGAWRTGAYWKFRHTDVAPPVVVVSGSGASGSGGGIHPYPIYSFYGQAISLPTVSYFGLGDATTTSNRTVFRMRQTVVGGSAIVPVFTSALSRVNLALLGEANGRWVSVGGADSSKAPSIDTVFTDATAPGLASQAGFVQFGEGVRMKPSLFGNRVHLNYMAQLQEFVAPSQSTSSFRRWTVDLDHQFAIYRQSPAPVQPEGYGPNDCRADSSTGRCPGIVPLRRIDGSWNKTGTIGFRALVSKSSVSDGAAVPFYFQQTLGGSDINGNATLASYDDYRFRGPHLVLLQETFEHSIAGPVGAFIAADQGKVLLQGESVGVSGLRRSFTMGATLRAGAAPMVVVSYATGGPEGHHLAFTMSTSLLGSSSRPSLH